MSRRDLFRSRSVVALLGAEVISTTGAQMTWIALPWFVLVTTGSATKMSFVVAAELIGVAALGFPGGRLLGRLGARRTMLLCDGARAPLMLVIPILHWTTGLSFAVLLIVAFLLGALAAPYFAAQKVIVPELAGRGREARVRGERALPGSDADDVAARSRARRRADRRDGGDERARHRCLHLHRLVRARRALRPAAPPGRAGEGGSLDPRRHPLHRSRPPAPRLVALVRPRGRCLERVLRHGAGARPRPVRRTSRRSPAGCSPLSESGRSSATWSSSASSRIASRGWLSSRPARWGRRCRSGCSGCRSRPRLSRPRCSSRASRNGLVNPSLHTISTLRIPAALRPNVMTTMMVFWALINPLGVFLAGPILDAFGTTPVLIGFAAVQTLTMAISSLAARARARAKARGARARDLAVTLPLACPACGGALAERCASCGAEYAGVPVEPVEAGWMPVDAA